MIPSIRKDAFVIMDLNDTFYTRQGPCKFMDLLGFIKLYKHVDGNLLFLTGHKSKKEVRVRFACLGLESKLFKILYTQESKGVFLKRFGYPKHTVFIDNSKRQVDSVKKHCPDIQCFLFN
jgi:hypothetical protein